LPVRESRKVRSRNAGSGTSGISRLNAAAPADFDKTYIDSQVTAHQDALTAIQAYAANGDTQALKDFAGKIAPVVQMHLSKATSIQAAMK